MGIYFTDQFSLLHLASGIVAYYWKISFLQWIVLHLLYEWITNANWGIYFINHYIPWPWGHLRADSYVNQMGDHFYELVGWMVGYAVVKYSYGGTLMSD